MERLAKALAGRRRGYAEAIGAAVLAYASALVGVQVSELVADDRWVMVVIHAAVIVVLFAVISVFTLRLGAVVTRLTEWRQNLVRLADMEAERVVTSVHERLTTEAATGLPALWVPHDAATAIKAEVFGLYRALTTAEGPALPGNRTNFEVSFMTRSPDDGRLTIMAWANHENRAPVSLTMRAANPEIYDRSATADMFRASVERRPAARLIESTRKAGDGYRELYPGQKSTIASTIVYPVLDLDTDLVGTLVAHCDKDAYFRDADYAFWCELLEPFASRIALEKLRLDATTLAQSGVRSQPA